MILVTVYKNMKSQSPVQIQFASREAFRQTPLPGNRVAFLYILFRERNDRLSMKFFLRLINNIDRLHQLTPPTSIQGRNISPFLQNCRPDNYLQILVNFQGYFYVLA